jgi:uncharacterized coiled-coil protein SlyX
MALADDVATLEKTVTEQETNYTALQSAVATVSTEITKLSGEVATLTSQLASQPGIDPALLARAQAVADGLGTQASALTAAAQAGG